MVGCDCDILVHLAKGLRVALDPIEILRYTRAAVDERWREREVPLKSYLDVVRLLLCTSSGEEKRGGGRAGGRVS